MPKKHLDVTLLQNSALRTTKQSTNTAPCWRKKCVSIFLCQAQAFDKVKHKDTLQTAGWSIKVVHDIKIVLIGRYFWVKHDGKYSVVKNM